MEKMLHLELFYLTFVSHPTLELRPVLTSLPYFKPFWVDLMGYTVFIRERR
jgi:hypothetical protein